MVRTLVFNPQSMRPFSCLCLMEKRSFGLLPVFIKLLEVDMLVDMFSLKCYTIDCHSAVREKGQML